MAIEPEITICGTSMPYQYKPKADFAILGLIMAKSRNPSFSVVVPLYNEAAVLSNFHKSLADVLVGYDDETYEIIYVDDGSTDGTNKILKGLVKADPKVKLVKLSRNFGKENALTAGIGVARGGAIITIDGDGQHPVELIPTFLYKWKSGAKVVVGVSRSRKHASHYKNLRSRLFYSIFNHLTDQKLLPGATDFRLIDREVQRAFLSLNENDRMTRALIDWLGFEREQVPFITKPRQDGTAGYSRGQLTNLAANSIVSASPKPLYLFGYLGVYITVGAFLLGLVVFIEQLILGDPWHWKFSGTAMLGILIIFLVGLVLISQGILSLYIAHIHSQSKQRPLHIIDKSGSLGLDQDDEA